MHMTMCNNFLFIYLFICRLCTIQKKCQTRRYQNKHNLLLKTLDYQIIVQINTAKLDLEDKRDQHISQTK